MKVFFLGDGAWASESFKQLLDRGGEIVGVVLRKRVTEEEFPNLVRKHAAKVFQDVDVNSESFAATIESLRAEILVCVSYDQIMKPEFLKRFPKGAWNLHASKLPKYRGRAAVYWALINGEQEIGVTFHEIAPKVDTGRILIQEMVPVTEDDDLGTMLPKLAKVAGEIVAKGVGLIDKGDYELREQVGDPSYCRRRKAGDEIIDWNWSSQRVLNFVRGLTRPGPGATTPL
ncbi:MAG: methionyl-tRNA formyltransferase, partial [Candidatus Lindowbacteria bacterium]|nr:methionyl-tRNA formyltransferase [Candidatus Lindowbacteria bacterium]